MHAQTLIALLPLLAYATPVRRQNNLQTFNGALGGEAATPVEDSGNADRPFQVGADTFVNIEAALARSCDQQFNRCANVANGGGNVAFEDCNTQKDECTAASAGAAGAGAGNNAANDNANANANANNNADVNAADNDNANANANANDNAANANASANANANANDNANANANDANVNDNAANDANANANGNANAGNANANDANANDNAANNANAGNANAGAGGEDFGTCDPTISLKGGRNGRPADELTFQSNDPQIEANQQEALNINIITNRICDELGNICGANDAAIAACEDAQAQIEALGTRDQTTADTWNQLVGGGAAKRSLRYGARRL